MPANFNTPSGPSGFSFLPDYLSANSSNPFSVSTIPQTTPTGGSSGLPSAIKSLLPNDSLMNNPGGDMTQHWATVLDPNRLWGGDFGWLNYNR